MGALDVRGPDEDLAERLGQGQIGQLLAGDLDRDVGLRIPLGVDLIEVGALDAVDQGRDPAQGAVVVQALHVLQQGLDLGVQFGHQSRAFGRRAAVGRVELGLEQGQDGAGGVGVFAQGRFLHRLRRVQAGLLAIAGQGADQGRLAPVDAQLEHQAVEAVALGAAVPHGLEGLFERRLQVGEHQVGAARILQQEVVDIDGLLADHADHVIGFLQRLQPHVGQDRQDVRQRHGRAAAVQLEAELQIGLVGRTEGAHRHRLGMDAVRRRTVVQAVELLEIGHRLGGVIAVAEGHAEALGPAGAGRADGGLVHPGLTQGAFKAVDPAAAGLGHLGLQGLEVGDRMLARRHADDVVDAGQRLVGQLRVPGRDPAAPGLGQDGADALAQAGVETLARDEAQHRDEAVERVAAREQADARAVIQVQDAQRRIEQLVLADLEEFVARIVLQDGAQPLVVMAARGLVGAGQGVGHLAPDQRHLMSHDVIGFMGEQADEAGLAHGPALVVEALDPDVVHIGPPVHARAHIALGHGDRLALVQLGLHGRRQHGRLIGAAQDAALGVAEHAQAVDRLVQRGLGLIGAVGTARVVVLACAQEDEMVVLDPAQESQVLLQHLGRHADRRMRLQAGDLDAHGLQHGGVVAHGGAHVGQGRGQALAQGVAALLRQGVDDDDDQGVAAPGLDLDDRVEQGADGDAGLGQFAQDAVDQEGAVVLQDQGLVIAGVDALGVDQGADGDAGGLAGLAGLGAAPGAGQKHRQVLAAQLGRLVRGVVVEGLGQQSLFCGARRRRNPRIGRFQRLQIGWNGGNDARSGRHD
ncbi:hypothetical protein D3C73_573200 [compost metagenome]